MYLSDSEPRPADARLAASALPLGWRSLRRIEAQAALPLPFIWPVALKTVIRQDRPHIAIEFDLLRCRLGSNPNARNDRHQ
jgi:hypothetical protein